MTLIETPVAAEAADRLDRARHARTTCQPVRDLIHDIPTAYLVQQLQAERRRAGGASRTGRKIGLTSEAVQRQLGVDQPDFGELFNDMRSTSHEPVGTDILLQPKIEAEVAFVLATDLDTEDLTHEAVRAAVDHAVAALEIVDSRIADWDITIVDTVADNASTGLYVLGDRPVPLTRFEPRMAAMRMEVNGTAASEGTGEACMGDPLEALAWLARTARDMGDPLRAGEVVLSGALGPMVPVRSGDTVTATISNLGTVSARFAAEDA